MVQHLLFPRPRPHLLQKHQLLNLLQQSRQGAAGGFGGEDEGANEHKINLF